MDFTLIIDGRSVLFTESTPGEQQDIVTCIELGSQIIILRHKRTTYIIYYTGFIMDNPE